METNRRREFTTACEVELAMPGRSRDRAGNGVSGATGDRGPGIELLVWGFGLPGAFGGGRCWDLRWNTFNTWSINRRGKMKKSIA
jgi:hypothetical protein